MGKALITEEKKAFVLEVHRQLSELYGKGIKYFHDLDALSELVSSLLSHRTKNKDSAQGYKNLLARFGNWEAVRDAPVEELIEELQPCTWPDQKAYRLKEVLGLITEKNGSLNLDLLQNMDVAQARKWLEELPGVGPKTSAAVLSFSTLRGKALPVDSHHYRVAVRLGIIDKSVGEGKSHAILEALLPADFTAQDVYDNHQLMMKHGQKICFHYNPACASCILLDKCPTGQARVEKTKAA